jgi:hypothetical protein
LHPASAVVAPVGMWATLLRCPHIHRLRARRGSRTLKGWWSVSQNPGKKQMLAGWSN